MPDELGNLLPGDEGYIAPEENNDTPPPAEEQTENQQESSDTIDETPTPEEEPVKGTEGTPVSELTPPKPDFYMGRPDVDENNPMLEFGDPLKFNENLNKENK